MSNTSAAPVTVRPIHTAYELYAVHGRLRSFTTLAYALRASLAG